MNERSKALELFHTRRYSEAIIVYEKLLNDYKDEQSDYEDCLFNIASCLASEGNFSGALERLSNLTNHTKDIKYNIALCLYKQGNYQEALKCVDNLLADCRNEFPELQNTNQDFNIDNPSIQNSLIVLISNLHFAILFDLERSNRELEDCLNDIPIGDIGQLDAITLHNQAICSHRNNASGSIEILSFLCNSEQTLADVHRNLLLLHLYYGQIESARKCLRNFPQQIRRQISNDELSFMQIIIEDSSNLSKLRNLLDSLLESKSPNYELVETIASYLNDQYWRGNQFETLERFLLQLIKCSNDNSMWRRNLAHTLFMNDTKFKEASEIYEEFLNGEDSKILDVDPIILGNLCVSYVLSGRNGSAERIIRQVETEELKLTISELSNEDSISGPIDSIDILKQIHRDQSNNCRQPSHLIIINLIIGTLYCVKSNYEFGLTRIFKSLEPVKLKLTTQSWYHVKRCLLSLLDRHSKQMLLIRDDLFKQILSFLIECEKFGLMIEAKSCRLPVTEGQTNDPIAASNCVAYEARHLRSIVLKIIHDA